MKLIKKTQLVLRGPKLSQALSLSALTTFPKLANVSLIQSHLETL